METKKLYIVSFGNSRQYLMEHTVPSGSDQLHKPDPFAAVEATLRAFLSRHLTEEGDFTYYTSARATEICGGHRERYAGFPVLNGNAIREIEAGLLKEVKSDRESRRINLNAPFAQILGKG